MFELPEILTLAAQVNEALTGRVVKRGSLGNLRHKFVWYNRGPAEFDALTRGKKIGKARARGRWLLIPMDPGYVLVLGECGGKVLFHPSGSAAPKKFHLHLAFEDGSALSVTTQMWGAMELHEKGKERQRKYIRGMRPIPGETRFTYNYFSDLVDRVARGEKRTAKGLLTQEQLIPGLGNAIAQDILFHAKLHPKHPIDTLTSAQRRRLYRAILATVDEITQAGGRYDETDLYGRPGGYVRIMDKNALGTPCPECGRKVEKIQYLGGACYFCAHCQE